MSAEPIVIAIDGPSGSGKSSVSKAVAQRLGYRYLDSGAMYRAAAWFMLTQNLDLTNAAAIAAHAHDFAIESIADPAAPDIFVDGTSVAVQIRSAEVTSAVSAVSAVPEIRTVLVDMQRDVIDQALAVGTGIVVEGRDIATVVAPDAALKVFLTADQEVRAHRRAAEDEGAGRVADVASTAESLAVRDAADSTRRVSPLIKADDAIEVDATLLNLEEVVEKVLGLALDAGAR